MAAQKETIRFLPEEFLRISTDTACQGLSLSAFVRGKLRLAMLARANAHDRLKAIADWTEARSGNKVTLHFDPLERRLLAPLYSEVDAAQTVVLSKNEILKRVVLAPSPSFWNRA